MEAHLLTKTLPLVAPATLLRSGDVVCVVDLRSPAEHEHDHVPGAVNVPLFDDLDRSAIGTLYARHSPEAAFREGRKRTVERIRGIVERVAEVTDWTPPAVDLIERVRSKTAGGIAALESELESALRAPKPLAGDEVVFYCWRGGLRSRSIVSLVRELGLDSARLLEGGYKGYRRVVREWLASWQAPRTFVLRGDTGVGKTLVLAEIERLRPGLTVDLEGLACHRSSILGAVGREPVTQKRFDSRLVERLRAVADGPLVFEGESRKVGDVILPDAVWRALCGGIAIQLTATTERRVDVLVEDYLATETSRAELAAKLPFIEERLGARWRGMLVDLLRTGRERELVELLLERYYDPLYRHSEGRATRTYGLTVDTSSPRVAAQRIVRWIEADGCNAR